MRGTAVVVGGGLGGVAAAVALRKVGWEVRVLERAPAVGEVGAGVGVLPNALRALEALGLADEVRRIGTPRVPGLLRDPAGRTLTRVDPAAERVIAVHRADLHRVLRSALPERCLATDHEVTASADLDADLVVAADGVGSRLRAELFPTAPPPVHTGVTAWRGVTAPDFPPDEPIGQTLGPGVEFGVLPLADRRVCWFAATEAEPGGAAPDEHAAVRALVDGWHDPIPAVLAATPPAAVLRNDIRELAADLPSFVGGRVALLGDAAHAMTPYLGQGACLAFEDAVVLAHECGNARNVSEALFRYDAARRRRTQAVARASRRAGALGHRLRNPLGVAVRNAVVRALPPAAVGRGMSRLTAWTPPSLDR
ncbi:FAD-dependent monooxygenase [Actinosynnema sp. NPDC020468]|uniref:FAD-dependent monooxygenase n=1 Tax=Actinosynnema sp. NPDC020468 TaxID=3154488 RepID=UPI0033C5B0B8